MHTTQSAVAALSSHSQRALRKYYKSKIFGHQVQECTQSSQLRSRRDVSLLHSRRLPWVHSCTHTVLSLIADQMQSQYQTELVEKKIVQ
jgi:hypothetical protein